MREALYNWVQDIAVWLVITSAALHALPDQEDNRYIRYFTGLVLILIAAAPALKLAGAEESFREMRMEITDYLEDREMEAVREQIREADIQELLPEEEEGEDRADPIQIHEIRIDGQAEE